MTIDAVAWQRATNLVNADQLEEADPIISELVKNHPDNDDVLFLAGVYLLKIRNYVSCSNYFRRFLEKNPENTDAQIYFILSVRQTPAPNAVLESRDACLKLLKKHPEVFSDSAYADTLLFVAAKDCTDVGPLDEGIRLWAMLAARTNSADHYYRLGHAYLDNGQFAEADKAIRKAMEIEPQTYTEAHHAEALQLIKEARTREKRAKVKRARYPDIHVFHQDLKTLICDHIATEHKKSPKIISKETKFFTMGSCFATNIYFELSTRGYDVANMDIQEQFNTTFSNKCFFDWLDGKLVDKEIVERIEDIVKPTKFPKESILERLKNCDVFIMTLGVAPAFFDRNTGDFIMPRPNVLSMQALAEKFLFRTTTVEENVSNVLHQLAFIRRINPAVKFVITVSPVPLLMTFEFDSAIVADCLSKCTMRLAAHQVVYNSGLKDIYYWPSFEIFRWAGSHRTSFYGSEDGQSLKISRIALTAVMDSFIEMFSG